MQVRAADIARELCRALPPGFKFDADDESVSDTQERTVQEVQPSPDEDAHTQESGADDAIGSALPTDITENDSEDFADSETYVQETGTDDATRVAPVAGAWAEGDNQTVEEVGAGGNSEDSAVPINEARSEDDPKDSALIEEIEVGGDLEDSTLPTIGAATHGNLTHSAIPGTGTDGDLSESMTGWENESQHNNSGNGVRSIDLRKVYQKFMKHEMALLQDVPRTRRSKLVADRWKAMSRQEKEAYVV